MIGITTDLWTDFRPCSFLAITIHLVSTDNNLQSVVVCVNEFTPAKTAENVKMCIIMALTNLGISFETMEKHIY